MEKLIREQEILNEVIKILTRHLKPSFIILFGSRGKGKSGRNSDFDLAVENKEKVEIRKQREIREEIEKVAGLYKVDIVYLNSVDERFKNIILKTGRVIYERRN